MLDFSWFSDPNAWAALATLTVLEVVLGIDNIAFISILVDRLPPQKRRTGRIFGLGLAMITRLMLLATLKWMMGLEAVLFSFPVAPAFWKMAHQAAEHHGMLPITGKGLILLLGGLFLIWKATKEIHSNLDEGTPGRVPVYTTNFVAVLIQIAMIDIIFSLDSVITAVGMADDLSVMALAVIISVGIMMLAAGFIGDFISRNPSIKMLALSFLLLIGTALIAEGLLFAIPKGYIYFAMAFSLGVELLNLRTRAKNPPPDTAGRDPQIRD
jgi:predicted tellurium resistance membrane protein TerC